MTRTEKAAAIAVRSDRVRTEPTWVPMALGVSSSLTVAVSSQYIFVACAMEVKCCGGWEDAGRRAGGEVVPQPFREVCRVALRGGNDADRLPRRTYRIFCLTRFRMRNFLEIYVPSRAE